MCLILWNLFSKCIQGRLDCIGETVLVKGKILLNNSIIVSASVYNVSLYISCFLKHFSLLHIFYFLPIMCELLVTVVFIKMSPELLNSLKDDISPSSEAVCFLHPVGRQNGNLIETVNERHMLPSEMLNSATQRG